MIKKFLSIMLCAALLLCPAACAETEAPVISQPVMREVYCDDTLEIDAGCPQTFADSNGQLYYKVHLHVANRSIEPMAVSTRLCVCVEYGDELLNCSVLPDGASPSDACGRLDGLILSEQSADGWVMFPYREPRIMRMRFAIDPARDEWVCFELPNAAVNNIS